MSSGARRAALAGVLFAAFILQTGLGDAIHFGASRPNLALTTLLVASAYAGANTGAVLGFLLGLLEGSYTSLYLGSYLVSRSLTGFAGGLVHERIFSNNAIVAVLFAIIGTVAAEGAFFLFAPQPHALKWAAGTLGEAIWSAALAAPIYLLLRRLLGRRTYE